MRNKHFFAAITGSMIAGVACGVWQNSQHAFGLVTFVGFVLTVLTDALCIAIREHSHGN